MQSEELLHNMHIMLYVMDLFDFVDGLYGVNEQSEGFETAL